MARRIGRIALLVAAGLLLLMPIALLAHPISYVPFVSAVLMVAVSYGYLQLVRRALTVSVDDMAATCERGQRATLAVTLDNRARVPLARVELVFFVTDLFGDYDDVRPLACSVRAHERVELEFGVEFAHLGVYEAGIQRVVVHDLLGLFSSTIERECRRQVTVKPHAMNLSEQLDVKAVPEETTRAVRPIAADDVDYAGVREYRYGDPMKAVHWNLSARVTTGSLLTRIYETHVNPTLAIVIDPVAPDDLTGEELMSAFDALVETAVAVSTAARVNGLEADVRYVDSDERPAATRLNTEADALCLVADMLHITPLGRASAAVSLAADEMVRAAGLHTHGSGNVVLVTARPDAALVSSLAEMAMRRRNALAFLSIPRRLVGRERETYVAPMHRLSSCGGSWWPVESDPVRTAVVKL